MKKEAKLILGGGAAYGLAHIGAIEAIREEFTITGIVGTSMGAIIGGLYAMGKEPQEILQIAQDSKTGLIFNPLSISLLPKTTPLNLLTGLQDRNKLLSLFRTWTKDALIDDLAIPFIAIGYDLVKSMTVLFDHGPLAEAMRASSSLPLIFAPFCFGNYLFVDGGVEHPLPVAFGDNVPGAYTIAINVLPSVSTEVERIDLDSVGEKHKLWAHQVFIQSLLQNQGFVAIQAMLQHPPDLYIDAHDPEKKMFDLFKAKDFYDYGYKAAREALDKRSEPNFMEQLLNKYQELISRFIKKQ